MEQRIKGTTGLMALIGSPVGHSGSPAMYNFSFRYHNLDYAYMAVSYTHLLGCGWPNHKTYKWSDTKKLLDFGDYNYEYETYWKEPQTGKILVTDGVEDGQDIGTKIYLRGKCRV